VGDEVVFEAVVEAPDGGGTIGGVQRDPS